MTKKIQKKENKWNNSFLWITVIVVVIVIGIGFFTTRVSDPIKMSFPESKSPDVANYKLYFAPVGDELTMDSYFVDLGLNSEFYINNLPLQLNEGTYQMGIAVVDLGGFEAKIIKSHRTLTVSKRDGLYFVYTIN